MVARLLVLLVVSGTAVLPAELADPAPWTTTAHVPALDREPGPPVPQPRRPAEPQRPPGRAPQSAEAAVTVNERQKERSSPGYAIYQPGDESSTADGSEVRSETRADAG